MSTDVKPPEGTPPAAPPAEDRIKNLQSEMDRKLSNVAAELKKSNDALAALMARNAPAPKAQETEDYNDLLYKDANAFTAKLEDRITKRVGDLIHSDKVAANKQNQTIAAIAAEFPEITSSDHELTKLAVQKFDSMPEEYRATPLAYKAAVVEAAAEMGIKPKSKRSPEENDAFSMGGRSGSSGGRPKRSKELDDNTKAFAELMDVDIDKVKARISKRKNFNSWE